MDRENLNKIIDWCEDKIDYSDYIEFPEELYKNLDKESSEYLRDNLKNHILIKLPEKEINFFEWVKENDPLVWDDLWGNDDLNKPYVVGIEFLPHLIYSAKKGFPICDLIKTDNYFFTESHMVDEESKVHIETAYQKLKNKEELSNKQLLVLEVKSQQTDIWHFAYKYNLTVNEAKELVDELVEDNALVHLKDAEYIAPFVEI